MLSLPVDLLAELLKDVLYVKHLVTFNFTSRTLRYTDCDQNIYYSGAWYDSHPIEFQPISAGMSLEAMNLDIVLSNIDQTFSDLVESEETRDKLCQIQRVFLDKNVAVVGTPITVFYGYTDTIDVDRPNARIGVADELIRWKTLLPRRDHSEHCTWKDFGGMECRYGENISNEFFAGWASATDMDDWEEFEGGAGTIRKAGPYSVKITCDGVNASIIRQTPITLVANTEYRLIIKHRETTEGPSARRFDFRTTDDAHFLKEDGTWNAGVYLPATINNETIDITFTTLADHTDYAVYPYAGPGETVWFDHISLKRTDLQTWCDRSKARCIALANYDNFGGFAHLVELQDKEIWWGRISSSLLNLGIARENRGH